VSSHAHVERLKPDLIVLDFSMPVMNKLQAALLLKNKLPHTPIIMCTLFVSHAHILDSGTESVSRLKPTE
jgi:CheY-like chemotaxis protein